MTQVTVGELLRRYRDEASFTQKELADLMGYHNSVVSRVERGRQLPTPEYLEQFIEALQLSDAERQEIVALYRQAAETVVDSSLSPPLKIQRREDWGEAPDVSVFYGRQEELSKLKRWIVADRCRLVGVLGMGGIGKTALAAKLVEQIKDEFDYVIWRSLLNAPPVEDVLMDYIQFLSDQQECDLPESVDRKISLLIEYLRKHRCLLVLDNAEVILRGGDLTGHYRDGYEEYGSLIRRVGETWHQSCLVLTSREKPREFARLGGKATPVRLLQLVGLDQTAAQEMLQDRELFGVQEAWLALVNRYAGNPLALKLVSATVQDVFGGNIVGFLGQGTTVFGDIRDLLDQQFNRLSELEQGIMYWLAIEREAIPSDDLRGNIVRPVSGGELLEALESLRRRSMIECNGTELFRLQPMVMEYITDRLVEQGYQEIYTEEITIFMSHALIKAQARDYVRASQVRVILNPVTDKLLASVGKEGVENKLRRILSTLRKAHPRRPGHGGGNVLNILVHIESDLSGYDFSNLTIWQAYLRDVGLHDVNFAYSDLSKSVFTETFGSILSVAFSPDGKLLAAGTANGEIRLWQAADGKQLLACEGYSEWIWSVAFSPDGHTLASGGEDGTVRLWDVHTGQYLKALQGHMNPVRSIKFSSDGHMLASGSEDHTVRLWDLSTGQCIKTLQGHNGSVRSVTFSTNGDMLASGSADHTVRLWDVNTGQCIKTLREYMGCVHSVAFSPDGGTLASGGEDQTVRLWDVRTGQCVNTMQGHTGWVRSVAFSPNSRMLASGSEDQTVRLWDVHAAQCLKTLREHTNRVWSVAFSPDGDTIASGSSDQAVRLWTARTGQCFNILQGHTSWVWSVALSPDGRTLASGSGDQTVRLWDICTGRCLKTLQGHTAQVLSVSFNQNGNTIASGGKDRTVRLWDVCTGHCLDVLHLHTGQVWSVAFSPNGSTIASGSSDQTVRLWAVRTGQCLNILQGHTSWVCSIAFSSDGRMLASGSDDRTVRLWDVSTGQCLKVLQGHTKWITSIVFDPDNGTLVSSSTDGTMKLWNLQTGECLRTLRSDRPYERMNITGATGLTEAQKTALKALGAIEDLCDK